MFIKLYLIALPICFVLDFIWLSLIAKNFYHQQIGYIMKDNFNLFAASLFYIFYIAGLVFFVIAPSIAKGSWVQAILLGAFLGFIAYSAYDLTNLATLKNWPIAVTVVDILWGMILSGSVSVLTYFIASKFFLIK